MKSIAVKFLMVWFMMIIGCSDDFNLDENPLPQGVQSHTFQVLFHQKTESSTGGTLETPAWLGQEGLCKIDYVQDIKQNVLNTQNCISSISSLKVVSVEFNLGENLPEDFEILAVETINPDGEGLNKVSVYKFNKDMCIDNLCKINLGGIEYMSNLERLKKLYSEGLNEFYTEGQYNPKYTPLTFVLDKYNPSIKNIVFNITIELVY